METNTIGVLAWTILSLFGAFFIWAVFKMIKNLSDREEDNCQIEGKANKK